jgi:hypothetical protein
LKYPIASGIKAAAKRITSVNLVGAVGIENKSKRNFKDLEEMPRSAKTLRRHSEEPGGIIIGPSMAPRFFERLKSFVKRSKIGFGPQSCGTDGKPRPFVS